MEFVKRNLTIVTTMIVVLCITAGIVVPFTAGGSHTETTTETVNDGGSWLKLAYGAPAGEIAITLADDVLTVGDQSGSDDDLVIAAWENGGIFTSDGSLYVLTENNGSTALVEASEATIAPAEGGITVTVGADTYTVISTDLLMPTKTGNYATFDFTDPINKVDDKDVVAFGTYLGVYGFGSDAYFEGYGYLGLVPDVTIVNGAITAVKWIMPSGDAKAVKEIKEPIEEKEKIEPEPENTIKYVPTPTYTDGDWGFDVISGTTNAIIVSYSGSAGNIVIPSTVSTGGVTYTVTEIGKDSANANIFDNSTITGSTITIPNSVTTINQYAFFGCSGFTGTLTIPDSVTSIGTYAFMACTGFTGNLTIGNSVTSIGNSAFQNCTGFTGSLTIPDFVTSIGTDAFRGCTGFTGNLTIGNSVTSIGNSAFYNCSGFTGNLTIGNSVTSIGNSAFMNCGRFTGLLVIPDSVTSIGTYAFAGCYTLTTLVNLSDATIQSGAFSNTSNLKQVLNLGSTEITATSYGLIANEVRTDVPATIVVGQLTTTSTIVVDDGDLPIVAAAIPAVIIIAMLVLGIRMWVGRND